MANPQKENGFTPISNEILENIIKLNLNSSELRILLTVIRKTYGWNKKEDKIPLTQFQEYTGLSRPTVVESLKRLVKYALLFKSKDCVYSVQKDWEKWVVKRTLLVKSRPFPSKADLTATSKADLTLKRKKDTIKRKKLPYSKSWGCPLRKGKDGKWYDVSCGSGNWQDFINGENDIIWK